MEKSSFTFFTEYHCTLILSPEFFLSLPNLKIFFWPYGKNVYVNILHDLFQRNHQVQATQDFVTETSQCWNCLCVVQLVFFTLADATSPTSERHWELPPRKIRGPSSLAFRCVLCVLVRRHLVFMLDICPWRPFLTYVPVSPTFTWISQNGYLKSVEFMSFKFNFCGDSFKTYIQHCDSFDVAARYPFLSFSFLTLSVVARLKHSWNSRKKRYLAYVTDFMSCTCATCYLGVKEICGFSRAVD